MIWGCANRWSSGASSPESCEWAVGLKWNGKNSPLYGVEVPVAVWCKILSLECAFSILLPSQSMVLQEQAFDRLGLYWKVNQLPSGDRDEIRRELSCGRWPWDTSGFYVTRDLGRGWQDGPLWNPKLRLCWGSEIYVPFVLETKVEVQVWREEPLMPTHVTNLTLAPSSTFLHAFNSFDSVSLPCSWKCWCRFYLILTLVKNQESRVASTTLISGLEAWLPSATKSNLALGVRAWPLQLSSPVLTQGLRFLGILYFRAILIEGRN